MEYLPMDREQHELLYLLPPGSDAAGLCEIDRDQIPWERVPALLALLDDHDEFLAFEASRILTSWGNSTGFDYLNVFVSRPPHVDRGWFPHRLHDYDECYAFALAAFVRFWTIKADQGEGMTARTAIFAPIERIIQLSDDMPFHLSGLFWLVRDEKFVEFIPLLKAHLCRILKIPASDHWKIADCVNLLKQFDEDFVVAALARHGKSLALYANPAPMTANP